MTYAKGSLKTPYGTIKVEWNIQNGNFILNVVVPACTKCNVCLPNGKKYSAGSGEYTFE